MNRQDNTDPEHGGEFPELDVSFEEDMEGEIVKVVVDALNKQGYPGLSPESLSTNPAHREAAIDMLRDCRPLPVIQTLIHRIENGQL